VFTKIIHKRSISTPAPPLIFFKKSVSRFSTKLIEQLKINGGGKKKMEKEMKSNADPKGIIVEELKFSEPRVAVVELN